MKLLLLCFVAGVLCTPWHQLDDYSFEKYVAEYNKRYSSAEEMEKRKIIFAKNLAMIMDHNMNSGASWKLGVNRFADWTAEEHKKLNGRTRVHSTKYQHHVRNPARKLSNVRVPDQHDWRTAGIISDVKDQGQCGSCWTFGTAETIESYWAQATGELSVLSEQQILDCTPNPNQCGGTGGCDGGTPELAYAKIMELGGLSSEWTYPYTSYWGTDFGCHFAAKNTPPIAKLTNFTKLPPNQYEPVLQHIAHVGPLAINVDASSWQFYETGVYNGCNQTNPAIDHVVQLVGYGTDEKTKQAYWLVRNSWSPEWGEIGYIRLFREAVPICGWDLVPSEGTGCNGGPSKVQVCGTCGILYDTSFPNVAKP